MYMYVGTYMYMYITCNLCYFVERARLPSSIVANDCVTIAKLTAMCIYMFVSIYVYAYVCVHIHQHSYELLRLDC